MTYSDGTYWDGNGCPALDDRLTLHVAKHVLDCKTCQAATPQAYEAAWELLKPAEPPQYTYVYQVRSPHPISAFLGMGSSPAIMVAYPGSGTFNGIEQVGESRILRSPLQDDDTFTIELIERNPR